MVAIGGLVRGTGIVGGQQRANPLQSAVDVARGHEVELANPDETRSLGLNLGGLPENLWVDNSAYVRRVR